MGAKRRTGRAFYRTRSFAAKRGETSLSAIKHRLGRGGRAERERKPYSFAEELCREGGVLSLKMVESGPETCVGKRGRGGFFRGFPAPAEEGHLPPWRRDSALLKEGRAQTVNCLGEGEVREKGRRRSTRVCLQLLSEIFLLFMGKKGSNRGILSEALPGGGGA